VAAIDLLVPGIGEIVGGSQRERNDWNCWRTTCGVTTWIPPINKWYLDLRRYGTVPHSGFGLASNAC